MNINCESTSVTTSEDTPRAITQSIEIGGEDSKEVTLEQTEAQLTSDDPWLQRKMAEKLATKASS